MFIPFKAIQLMLRSSSRVISLLCITASTLQFFTCRHPRRFLAILNERRLNLSAHGVIFEDRLSDYPLPERERHARLSASWLRSTAIIHHFVRKLINIVGERERALFHFRAALLIAVRSIGIKIDFDCQLYTREIR
jgi:hypothetical protein